MWTEWSPYTTSTGPGGEVLTIPPIPKEPPCTCGRRKVRSGVRIVAIIIVNPTEISNEEAERLKASACVLEAEQVVESTPKIS